jgi:hypothetical protein
MLTLNACRFGVSVSSWERLLAIAYELNRESMNSKLLIRYGVLPLKRLIHNY